MPYKKNNLFLASYCVVIESVSNITCGCNLFRVISLVSTRVTLPDHENEASLIKSQRYKFIAQFEPFNLYDIRSS